MEQEWVSWINQGKFAQLIAQVHENPHMRTSLHPYTGYQSDMATPLGYAIITDNVTAVRALLPHDNVNNICWCDVADDTELDALALGVQKQLGWIMIEVLLNEGAPSPDSLRFSLFYVTEVLADMYPQIDPYLKYVREKIQHSLAETLDYLDRFCAIQWCAKEISAVWKNTRTHDADKE